MQSTALGDANGRREFDIFFVDPMQAPVLSKPNNSICKPQALPDLQIQQGKTKTSPEGGCALSLCRGDRTLALFAWLRVAQNFVLCTFLFCTFYRLTLDAARTYGTILVWAISRSVRQTVNSGCAPEMRSEP